MLTEHKTSKRTQSIDIMKFVLAVLVVIIHAEVDVGLFHPFLSMAIPIFFITSSYFFFGKILVAETQHQRNQILFKFLKRNMMLYSFWFLALLPVTLYIRDWFSGSAVMSVLRFLQSFLFNSTFRGSWYIMALNIGVALVLLLSRKLKTPVLLALGFVVYLVVCLTSNYYGLIERSSTALELYNGYMDIFRSVNNSFPAGIFWIVLGKALSENDRNWNRGFLLAVIAVSSVLLLVEHGVITYFGLALSNHGYLALVPLCVAVFCFVRNAQTSAGTNLRLGHMSTIVYAIHTSLVTVLGAVLHRVTPLTGQPFQWVLLVLTMLFSLACCGIIFLFEEKKGFRWLRFAY